jgi:uncharacterized protein (TIGR02687 family)
MSNIEARLKDIFEKYNIVFWYDDEGKLKDEFEALNLDVKKFYINNNEFSIKYEILTSKKGSKFLVYSDKKEPQDRDNWLIDLVLRGYKFSADRASMILNDLGIDLVYKPFIENHLEFFKAKKRVKPFIKLLEEGEDEKTLALKMIATLLKCDVAIEPIVIKLLDKSELFEEIIKYKLDEFFWKSIKDKYNYKQDNPTIKDFGYKLLQNHFYFFINRQKCLLNKESILFVKNWMDSSTNKNSFRKLSKTIQKELSIEQKVKSCNFYNIIECDSYEVCEQYILSTLLKMILTEKIDNNKALKICKKRELSFWYSEYKNIYKAIISAIKLKDLVNKNTFSIKDFNEGIKEYVDGYSKIDYYYRKYIGFANNSEHLDILKELNSRIEDIYLNDYLRVINENWQTFVKDYKNSSFGYQKDFYKNTVLPTVTNKQKIFVIISDALRYECGVELKNKIIGLNRFDANIEPLVSMLPSFTQLGIASLLPHKRLSFEGSDDSVFVDGVSSKGSKNRDNILKKAHNKSVYIDSERFLEFNRQMGRNFIKENDVIYIYHNEIDATGDKRESEHKVFNAVDSSFETIEKLIKQITNLNGNNIFITSDHGFLYQNSETKESEFCKVTKPLNPKRFNRRFIISDDIESNTCLDIYKASNFFIDSNELIALAKSINKIRLQGGGHRFVHGGASLQEMIIPLISIKKRRKDDVKSVEVSAIISISRITTNSVIIPFYQEEPINQKIKPLKLKMAFYSKDGILISNSQTFNFDSQDEYERNRETKLQFDFKQNASDYSGEDIKLVIKKLIDGSNEEPIYKEYNIKLQLSFANDFDDF